MKTFPLSQWTNRIRSFTSGHHTNDLCDWRVKSVSHWKTEDSIAAHEYLKVDMERGGSNPADSAVVFVERNRDGDHITTGWKPIQCSDPTPVWALRREQTRPDEIWKAITFSRGNLLCMLIFTHTGISLLDFAQVLDECMQKAPKYSIDNCCYWFASTVYEILKEDWASTEIKTEAHKHKGKLMDLTVPQWLTVDDSLGSLFSEDTVGPSRYVESLTVRLDTYVTSKNYK